MTWLARGAVDEVDPDALVEVTQVLFHEGPMLVAALERAGVPARGIEAWSVVTKTTSHMRIVVRAGDAERALEVIAEAGVRPRHLPY